MAIIFLDGFDFYNTIGGGKQKWDQGSTGGFTGGRFGGQAFISGDSRQGYSAIKTLPVSPATIIVGFAMFVGGFTGAFGGPEFPSHPFFIFYDGTTPQCSLWINPSTLLIELRQGLGESSPVILMTSTFVPPIGLWYYLECKVTIGSSGSVDLHIDSQSVGAASGIQTQQSGAARVTKVAHRAYNQYSGGVQAGAWLMDDFYVIDTTDATNHVDFLGECRIQTQYPDADGFQNDFTPSIGSTRFPNVNTHPTSYTENGKYNFSGTVGAIDLYSMGNFTISGTIFAVQSNLVFRKDDVGNRQIQPLMRTNATNYNGSAFPCFSTYTYASAMWEIDPATGLPWILTDLNQAEFGIKISS
jgi:hypothetical protein